MKIRGGLKYYLLAWDEYTDAYREVSAFKSVKAAQEYVSGMYKGDSVCVIDISAAPVVYEREGEK